MTMLYNKIDDPRSKGYTQIRWVKDMSEAKKYDRSYKGAVSKTKRL